MNFESFPQPEVKTNEKKQEEPKKSRIAWRSKLTGYTGHGEFIAEGENVGGETIEEHLKGASEENPDLEHWLEVEGEVLTSEKKINLEDYANTVWQKDGGFYFDNGVKHVRLVEKDGELYFPDSEDGPGSKFRRESELKTSSRTNW